jgi:hypothetical protein
LADEVTQQYRIGQNKYSAGWLEKQINHNMGKVKFSEADLIRAAALSPEAYRQFFDESYSTTSATVVNAVYSLFAEHGVSLQPSPLQPKLVDGTTWSLYYIRLTFLPGDPLYSEDLRNWKPPPRSKGNDDPPNRGRRRIPRGWDIANCRPDGDLLFAAATLIRSRHIRLPNQPLEFMRLQKAAERVRAVLPGQPSWGHNPERLGSLLNEWLTPLMLFLYATRKSALKDPLNHGKHDADES